MVEPLDGLELALEPGHRVDRSDQLEVQHLDRDALAIRVALRAPHLPESAFTDQAIELMSRKHDGLGAVQQSTLTIASGGPPIAIARESAGRGTLPRRPGRPRTRGLRA